LKQTITGDTVWKLSRRQNSPTIEIYQVSGKEQKDILSEEFLDWRLQQQQKTAVAIAQMLG
ncbi:hypothetical protein LTS18_002981, partial [Coniosporium uncinatum]